MSVTNAAAAEERIFYPRLALLAAVIYNPALLIVYLLYRENLGNVCIAGPLCSFGAFPGVLQVFLLILGWIAFWMLLYATLRYASRRPHPPQALAFRWIRAVSDFRPVRDLLSIYAIVLSLLFVFAVLNRAVPPVIFLLAACSIGVSLWCAYGARNRLARPSIQRARRKVPETGAPPYPHMPAHPADGIPAQSVSTATPAPFADNVVMWQGNISSAPAYQPAAPYTPPPGQADAYEARDVLPTPSASVTLHPVELPPSVPPLPAPTDPGAPPPTANYGAPGQTTIPGTRRPTPGSAWLLDQPGDSAVAGPGDEGAPR
jgi:hypothetical protein